MFFLKDTYRLVQPSSQSVSEHFQHPKTPYSLAVIAFFPPVISPTHQPQATTNLLCISLAYYGHYLQRRAYNMWSFVTGSFHLTYVFQGSSFFLCLVIFFFFGNRHCEFYLIRYQGFIIIIIPMNLPYLCTEIQLLGSNLIFQYLPLMINWVWSGTKSRANYSPQPSCVFHAL